MHIRRSAASFALAATFLASLGSASAAPESPYAGQEGRDIKALAQDDIEGLLAGKGMGFAKAAELNGYPGPAHVLELSSRLRLTEAQAARTKAIHTRMEAAAKAAGASLVEAERELEALFRSRSATEALLRQALSKAASAQARVREAHLRAHLEQTDVLSAEQVARYEQLRGYSGPHGGHRLGRHEGLR